jgi:hypothetical protein
MRVASTSTRGRSESRARRTGRVSGISASSAVARATISGTEAGKRRSARCSFSMYAMSMIWVTISPSRSTEA